MIARENQGNRLPPRRLCHRVKRALRLFARVRKDDGGATLIEYSILIGLISTAVVLMVFSISGFIGTKWTTLNSALP